MYNKLIRKTIKVLFNTMKDDKRMDIYHKYETIGDLAYSLPFTTKETRIKDISMQDNNLEEQSKKAGFYVLGHKNYGDVYEA